jgi:hypothetical protein
MVLIGSRFPEIVPQLAPLGVLLALVAAPRASSAQTGKPGLRELALLAVALAALRPEWTLASVGVGIAVAGWFARAEIRSVPWAHVGWAAIAAALALIAIAGGTPEMAATGLELIGEQLGDWAAPGLTLAGALLAALSDGTAASVVGLGVLDRALSLQIPGAPAALAAGLAVGGLGPLLVAGALRAGWKLWLFQVMIVAMYTAWVVA